MTVKRMDNVAIMVDDLAAAVAFFSALGLELEGETSVEGKWVDRILALDGARTHLAMLRTPDGHSRLELTEFQHPVALQPEPKLPPANTLGLHRVMFAVTDLQATVERLRRHGGELIGEITKYEEMYLLCYLRGPSGIIVALAEQLGAQERPPLD